MVWKERPRQPGGTEGKCRRGAVASNVEGSGLMLFNVSLFLQHRPSKQLLPVADILVPALPSDPGSTLHCPSIMSEILLRRQVNWNTRR